MNFLFSVSLCVLAPLSNLCAIMEPIECSIHLLVWTHLCAVPLPKPVSNLPQDVGCAQARQVVEEVVFSPKYCIYTGIAYNHCSDDL